MNLEPKFCATCGDNTLSRLILTPDLPHYGKLVCDKCLRWRTWVGKPDSDANKYRRPKQHQDLVAKYSRGFCELCLQAEADFRPRIVLEAHHVVEYQDGGNPSRDNVWILCTACHKLVTWMRKYVGRNELPAGIIPEVARGLTDAQDQDEKHPD